MPVRFSSYLPITFVPACGNNLSTDEGIFKEMVTSVIAPEEQQIGAPILDSVFRGVCSFPVLLAVLLASAVFLALPKTNADPDIGWHLRNAQFLLQHHAVLHQDVYSFTTRGKPWMDPEWLAEVPFYLASRWFGARGIFLVTYLSITVVLLGVFGLATMESGNVKGAFLASILALALATVSFGPRTLLFGWIFLVVELAILYRFGERSNRIWALPPLFMVWVNTHGSWLIGLVVFALFGMCGCVEGDWGAITANRWSVRQGRKLAGALVFSVLALFVNPYGWRLVAYPFDLAFRQKLNIANIIEWRSVDFHSPRGKVVLAALICGIVVQLARRRRWKLHEVAFLLLGVYAGFTYSRFLFLAAILIVPLLAKDLRNYLPRYSAERDKPWLNAVIIVACAAAICWKFPASRALRDASVAQYPVKAQVYLDHFHPEGKVLNDYLWGGYMIWNVRQVPVFVDSRVDIFEHNGIFKDYLDLVQLQGSFRVLDKYSIRYVLFRTNAPLSYLLEHSAGWKVDYRDKTTILFERNGGWRQ